MITAQELHRLAVGIVAATIGPDEDSSLPRSTSGQRERIADFAEELGLDLQNTATLYSVAACAALEPAPRILQ